MDSTWVFAFFLLAAMMGVVVIYAARYKVVPPDSALVIYGRVMDPRSRVGYRVLTSGGKFIVPIVESYERLDLSTQKIELDFRDVKVIHEGVDKLAQVRARAEVGIGDSPDVLKVAAEHLLHVSQADIARISKEVFESALRAHLRKTPFEETSFDLTKTSVAVASKLKHDLLNIGIRIDDLLILELKLRGGSASEVV
jgi:uncharacterized membrane protein YqiK